MSFRTLSAIVRGPWAIHQPYVQTHLPLIASMLKGGNVLFPTKLDTFSYADDDDDRREEPRDKVILMVGAGGTIKASRYSSFNDAPEGSIALIPIVGPILKYGGDCGEPGSIHMNQWTQEAKASSKISGAIFKFDTPGGQVDGTATLADSIKSFGKPNFGYIDDGMMASAGMWIGSATDKIFASQPTDSAGSIGVLSAFFDYIDHWKKEGINYHEIYAPQSTDKNGDYRAARDEGNYGPIKADLAFLADQFISTIKENRKGKLNLKADNPFTGKMFYAKDAISVGLIDGIASLTDLVDELSMQNSPKRNSNKSIQNSNNNIMSLFGKKDSKLSSLKGVKPADITEEMLDAINEEVVAEGIEGVRVVADSDLSEQATKITGLETANAKLTADLALANAAKDVANTAKDKAIQDLADFKAARGGEKTVSIKKGTDELPEGEKADGLTDVDREAREKFNRTKATAN
jgi:protease-4